MKIDEILGRPNKYTVEEDTPERFTAKFMAGGREVVFMATNEGAEDENDESEWHIMFGEVQTKRRVIKLPGQSDTYTDVEYNKTGSGSELEVFATLKAVLEDFTKKRKPRKLMFSADRDKKDNRARVYAKMFKRNMPKGWRLDTEDMGMGDHAPIFFSLIKEALDRSKSYRVVKENDEYFSAKFTAGSREVMFMAELLDERAWEISFAQLASDGKKMNFDLTKSGNELEVFATVGKIIKEFIITYSPDQVTFAAATRGGQENRASLYARLTKKFFPSDWKTHREDDDGVTFFTMLRPGAKKLDEGKMKRSDPYISGDKWGPRPPDMRLAPKPETRHAAAISSLVRLSGKTRAQVQAAWNKAAEEVPDGVAKWPKVMRRAKADLGVSV